MVNAPEAAGFSFELPPLQDEADLFGPSASNVPAAYAEMPYQSFNKSVLGSAIVSEACRSERLGAIVDWTSSASTSTDRYGRQIGARLHSGATAEGKDGASSSLYAYRHDEDEATFSLVDGARDRPGVRRGGGPLGGGGRGLGRGGARGRGGYNARGAPGLRGARGTAQRGGAAGRRGGYDRGPPRNYGGWGTRQNDYWNRDQRVREASVTPGPDWQVLEEIEFVRLGKLRLEVDTEDPETISQHGFLYEYDRAYDRINTKNTLSLQHMERLHYNPTASEDPVLQSLAGSGRGRVFTTDTVLSMLMCSPRSVYSWDLVLLRDGDNLFIDKRDQGPLDYLTVNENAAEPPAESEQGGINTPAALSQQATFLNENFAWQVVREDQSTKLDFEHPNPFYSAEESEAPASCGYRYRKFDLSITENEDIEMVVRTEVDAKLSAQPGAMAKEATPAGDDTVPATPADSFITLKTLFEFDPRATGAGGALDWRTKLDAQRGAVIATEMKNNNCKLARWAVQSILAGAEQMKIGYVSRQNPRDENRHVILGTQWFKPRDFASQMNINLANGFGIVRTIVDLCLKQPEGKYVLLRDPMRPLVRLYSVPINAFDDQAEEDDELLSIGSRDSDPLA